MVTQHDAVDLELGELIKTFAGSGSVLTRFGIDFTRDERATLTVACRAAGADPADVWTELVAVARRQPNDWANLRPVELVDHISTLHHEPLRERFPAVVELMAEVLSAHGNRHRDLTTVSATLSALAQQVASHLSSEDRAMLPAVRPRDAGGRSLGETRELVSRLESDHERITRLLARLRAATAEYRPPADGDERYIRLFAELELLEAELHMSMFKETHMVFRAIGDRSDSLIDDAAADPSD
jgi:regulator of cell morphogenesis and NO signaling